MPATALALSIDGGAAQAMQGMLSTAFGFADFTNQDGDVRVARPVAVAETAGGHDDQSAIVRIRQNGEDDLSLTLYRVDDLNGAIGGLHPGDAGYEAALHARAYHTTNGDTAIRGPGYGDFTQVALQHVNAGDLIAMELTNNSTGDTYSAFAQANEVVNGQPCRASVELRAEHLGLGRHQGRRRPRLQRSGRRARFHQRVGTWVVGVEGFLRRGAITRQSNARPRRATARTRP